jgi:hypothetical protein
MDPQQLGVGAGFAGLIVFIVLIGIWASKARERMSAAIQAVADAGGFTFKDNGLERLVDGIKDGRPMRLAIATEGGRPNGILEQRWKIDLKHKPPEKFAATKNGWRTSVSEGAVRLDTGDAAFDKTVLVEGADQTAKSWLTDARKVALLELIKEGGLLYDGAVLLHKVGLEAKPGVLVGRFHRLWSVAERLE